MELKNEKNEASNSLGSSKKSITEDFSEKSKNTQEKDKSDTKSIKTTTEEDQIQDEVIDLPSPDNANNDFGLNKIERNMIYTHMFPLNLRIPRYKESIILCLADKIVATKETIKRK